MCALHKAPCTLGLIQRPDKTTDVEATATPLYSHPSIQRMDSTPLCFSKKRPKNTNLEKHKKKKRKTTWFKLREDSYHTALRKRKLAGVDNTKIAIHKLQQEAMNFYKPLKYDKDKVKLAGDTPTRKSARLSIQGKPIPKTT